MIETLNGNLALLGVVWVLAVYRMTKLVVFDEILGKYPKPHLNRTTGEFEFEEGDHGTGLRRLLDFVLLVQETSYDGDGDPVDVEGDPRNAVCSWLSTLLKCPHCVGVWASGVVLLVWYHGPEWMLWATVLAAIAGAQSYIASRPGA
jgi:hypothetical protein